MTGRQYTFANSLPYSTYEKLDRVLMTTEWEFMYPMVTVQALDRGVSDHAPLLLDTGDPAYTGHAKQFKMELSWLAQEDFRERIIEIWNKPVSGQHSVQRWNRKMGALRNTCGGGLAIIMGSIEHKKNTSNWLSLILTLRLKLGHSQKRRGINWKQLEMT